MGCRRSGLDQLQVCKAVAQRFGDRSALKGVLEVGTDTHELRDLTRKPRCDPTVTNRDNLGIDWIWEWLMDEAGTQIGSQVNQIVAPN